MADEQKPAEPKKHGTEASATDLLSLWGGQPTPQPKPPLLPTTQVRVPDPRVVVQPPKPTVPKPPISEPIEPRPGPPPSTPKPPRDGSGIRDQRIGMDRPELKKEPEEKPKPKVEKAPAPKPREEALEGEIINPPQKSSGPATAAPEPEFLEEREGFGSQLDEFLQELNLSRKHLIYGIVFLILLVVLVFGGIAGFRYYKNKKAETPLPPKPPTEISTEETGVLQTADVGKLVILSGKSIGDTGLMTAISIGTQPIGITRIAGYIMTFRRLQNAYATDINELLNKATDRRARLRSHLALLRKLQEEGNENLVNIKTEIEVIKVSYEPERQRQEETDLNFFEQLNALNAQTTEEILDEFVVVSQRVIAYRARFKALQKIAAFYEEALPKLLNRIRDIELNEEPLVTGIKVYDVRGSDLQLILPVSGDQIKEEEKLASPAIPFIPVHPSKVGTGKDFITQPGGGF